MTLHTAPRNQGQIVTYSFGWYNGAIYMQRMDANSGAVTLYRASVSWLWLDEEEVAELESWDPRVDADAPKFLDFDYVSGDRDEDEF
jgi:hypothetical protein